MIVKTESASSLSATCAEYKLNVSVVALGAIAVECVRSVATGAALLLIDIVLAAALNAVPSDTLKVKLSSLSELAVGV